MSAILMSGQAAACPDRSREPPQEAESPLFQANREWEIDRALMLERSERRAWRVAVAGLILGLVGIAAVFV
jgi:type IV secretion system protein VirB8